MKVTHLVVDSGALIKNAPIHEIGECIYTVEQVVTEIKDKATRQRLQCLPYNFIFRDLPQEILKQVTEFSKKTGDYPSLSATDLQLLGLTLFLEKENFGIEHLNLEGPTHKTITNPYDSEKNPSTVGFYKPKETSDKLSNHVVLECTKNKNISEESTEIHKDDKENYNYEDETQVLNNTDDENITKYEDINDESDKNLSSDDEGWITPTNIAAIKKEMKYLQVTDEKITVACITTDFAMQNVLLQMGLKVMSVEGMQIKKMKTFILRCHACFKSTSIMTKKFCPNCGNMTLKRVSVSVNDDGTKSMQINFRKPINIRGTRYSLPIPKGGKHAQNPILFEDQPIPQNKPSSFATQKLNVFDPDYVALSSPFAVNDIYSRASHLGIRNRPSTNYQRKWIGGKR